jgi:hypothetical protein
VNKLLTSLVAALALSLVAATPAFAKKPSALAEGQAAAGSADAATNNTTITKSFADMGAGKEPLRLNTWQAGYMLKLPLSPREILTSAKVTLSTANSTALIKSRSELSVRVNGHMLSQYALDPVNTIQTREIVLPVEYLKPGYNEVFFNVVQHYTYDCEDPSSPELWTEINPVQSGVTLNFAGFKPNTSPRLSQLHIAFDKRGWLSRPLSVVTGTEHVSEAQMAAATLVVEGLGLRMGFRPLDIDVYGASTGAALKPEATRFPGLSSAVVKGRDVLLVGRRAELSRYMDPEIYQLTASGPFVGVFPAQNGDSLVLVVSGTSDEELMTAARSLAEPNFKFSDVSMESIKDQWAFKQPTQAKPGVAQAFTDFDFRTTGSRGVKVQPIQFEFRAPADYGAKKGDLATLRLHFSYGAGLRKDSSMTIKLNGQFAVAVPLSEPSGSEFQKYEVRVPAQYIRPGYNQITFEPIFIAHKDRCDMVRDEGMVLTIYEDSALELPPPSVVPKAPDLERFSQGFWPLQEALRLYLTQRDTQTAAAALTFASSVAQKNRAPFDVELRYSPFETGHMMAIGPYGGLSDFVTKALPLRKYTWSAEGSQAGLLQAVEGKRVITAFLAGEPTVLRKAVRVLDEKGLWNGMSGQAAVVDTVEQTMVTEPATDTVDFGVTSKLNVSVSSWKPLALGTLALAAAFAVAFIAALRRFAEKRRKVHWATGEEEKS